MVGLESLQPLYEPVKVSPKLQWRCLRCQQCACLLRRAAGTKWNQAKREATCARNCQSHGERTISVCLSSRHDTMSLDTGHRAIGFKVCLLALPWSYPFLLYKHSSIFEMGCLLGTAVHRKFITFSFTLQELTAKKLL